MSRDMVKVVTPISVISQWSVGHPVGHQQLVRSRTVHCYPCIISGTSTVFYNFFCEAEPLAVILIARGAHVFLEGGSRGPKGWNSRPKAERADGLLGRGQ